jgi:hypothetical protein
MTQPPQDPRPYGQPNYGPPGYGQMNPYFPAAAPKPGSIPLRPLMLSDIIAGAAAVMRRQPRLVFCLAVIAASAQTVLSVLARLVWIPKAVAAGDTRAAANLVAEQLGTLLTSIVGLVFTALLSAAIALITAEDVVGRRVTWRWLRSRLRPRAGRIVVLSLLVSLLPLLALPVFGLGIWLWGIWTAAMPALMIERMGIRESLGRSRALVRGDFWRVWGIRSVCVLVAGAAGSVLTLPFLAIALAVTHGSVFEHTSAGVLTLSNGFLLITAIGSWLAAIVSAPFQAAVNTLLYIDQRMRKEGLAASLQQAAQH